MNFSSLQCTMGFHWMQLSASPLEKLQLSDHRQRWRRGTGALGMCSGGHTTAMATPFHWPFSSSQGLGRNQNNRGPDFVTPPGGRIVPELPCIHERYNISKENIKCINCPLKPQPHIQDEMFRAVMGSVLMSQGGIVPPALPGDIFRWDKLTFVRALSGAEWSRSPFCRGSNEGFGLTRAWSPRGLSHGILGAIKGFSLGFKAFAPSLRLFLVSAWEGLSLFPHLQREFWSRRVVPIIVSQGVILLF